MKTTSGIAMMTAAEIIEALKKFPPDQVVVFEVTDVITGQKCRSVLQALDYEKATWHDDGKGTVIFRDEKDKEIFVVKKETK